MSGISKNIRKITKAWGGETTGSGIGDAVRDLYDSLPFSVKTEMVEILPEQSVTGELKSGRYYTTISPSPFELAIGKKYKVAINGNTYNVNGEKREMEGLSGVFVGDGTLSTFPFAISYGVEDGESGSGLMWSSELGETITLAIYEEQEVVKKLDPKFVGKTVLYAVATNEDTWLYHDEALSEKVTKSELFSMNGNVLVYVDLSGNGLNYRYYSPTAYFYGEDYGVVYLDNGNTELQTSEDVNAGPM